MSLPDARTDHGRRIPSSRLAELGAILRTPLVADALDAVGLRHQCFGPGFAPLNIGDVVVGHAFTVAIEPVDEVPDVPYQGLLASLDAISAGDVYVAALNSERPVAIWGELISAACISAGAVGAVVNGYARDTPILRTLDFPVLSRGTMPQDSNGRSEVIGHLVPVEVDGVAIEAGDLIVGDDDGVVVVPSAHIDTVVAHAIRKNSDESEFRTAVRGGMSAVEAFKKYGVL